MYYKRHTPPNYILCTTHTICCILHTLHTAYSTQCILCLHTAQTPYTAYSAKSHLDNYAGLQVHSPEHSHFCNSLLVICSWLINDWTQNCKKKTHWLLSNSKATFWPEYMLVAQASTALTFKMNRRICCLLAP